MASPLPSAKQSVSLASADSPGSNKLRGSRIRRDPPAVVKPVAVVDPERRDARAVFIGILTFTIALMIIAIGISSFIGWSPRNYTAHL